MDNFRIAVKSFIVNSENKILLIKRRSNDVHKPGSWNIHSGRLKPGEDPFLGLKRKTKEETNIDIEIMNPLDVQHFIRDDNQIITMLIFLCKPLHNNIKLSEEHTEFQWTNIDNKEQIPNWLLSSANNFLKFYNKNI